MEIVAEVTVDLMSPVLPPLAMYDGFSAVPGPP